MASTFQLEAPPGGRRAAGSLRRAAGRAARVFVVVSLGTAMALLTLEAVSRWYFHYQQIPDPALGPIVPAGFTVRNRTEGAGSAHHEERGIRRAATLGPRRGLPILCVGDSFTQAYQVSDEEVYTTLVEQALNKAGVSSAVLSFGRTGWSVADYVARASAWRDAFMPAWTVVQVHDTDFTSDAWEPSKTHFRQSCDTCAIEVVPVPVYSVPPLVRSLGNRSALAALAITTVGRLARAWQGGGDSSTTAVPSTSDVADAESKVTEELRMLSEAYDGRLTVLLVGWFDPLNPGRDTPLEAVVKRAASRLGISVACSKDEYDALASRRLAPHGFGNTGFNWGHLNAEGHAATARVLGRELLRLRGEGRL